MHHIFLKNSNDNLKNFSPYIEKLVFQESQGQYEFYHDTRPLLNAVVKDEKFFILHSYCDPKDFESKEIPYREFNLNAVIELLSVHQICHLMVADCPVSISDQDMIKKSLFAIQDENGILRNPDTNEPISKNEPSPCILLLSAHKIPKLDISVFILHYPFLVNKYSTPHTTEKFQVHTLLECESIKENIFMPKLESGVDNIVGNHYAFCNDKNVRLSFFNNELKDNISFQDFVDNTSINTSADYEWDIENQSLNIKLKDKTSPFNLDIDGGDFLNTWIHHKQRFNYNYLFCLNEK